MKQNQTNPSSVTASVLSAIDQLRADYESIRDEKIIGERAAAEAAHLMQLAADTSDPEKRRGYNLDLVLKNQEGSIATKRAEIAAKNLAATSMNVLGEIGALQARLFRLTRACDVKVVEAATKQLAPHLTGSALHAAIESTTQVREQRHFAELNSHDVSCGNSLVNDGAGSTCLLWPVNVPGLLSAHDELARRLANFTDRARKLGVTISPDQTGDAQSVVKAGGASFPPRRQTPAPEAHATFRVQLRVLESLSLGYVSGHLEAAARGEILDLPLLPGETCLASLLMASDRVEVISKLPVRQGHVRKFVSVRPGTT